MGFRMGAIVSRVLILGLVLLANASATYTWRVK
jgi:hypothetical protein